MAPPDAPPSLACAQCGQTFSRRDHLDRHCFSHKNERPFTCTVCGKSYARRDVYQRHLQMHNAAPSRRRQKANVACDTCRSRKMRCHPSEYPCPRCKAAGLTCTFRQDRTSITHPTTGHEGRVDKPVADGADEIPRERSQSAHDESQDLVPEPQAPSEEMQASFAINENEIDAVSFVNSGTPSQSNFLNTDPNLLFLSDDLLQSEFDWTGDFSWVFEGAIPERDLFLWTKLMNPDCSVTDGTVDELLGHVQTHQSHVNGANAGRDVENTWQQRRDRAFAKLHEYSTASYPSRPGSPRSTGAYEPYLQGLITSIFKTQIAPMFPCFQNFKIVPTMPQELYLAMAAAGGLCCTNPGSEKVAKWLFHATRRKLLTSEFGVTPIDHNRRLWMLQTYILIEIYAYLSGDKRTCNLLDIFHNHLIQGMYDIIPEGFDSNPSLDRQIDSLIHSVYVLECYRVVLLQRPSMLYPGTYLDPMSSLFQVGFNADHPGPGILDLCNISILGSHTRHLLTTRPGGGNDLHGSLGACHGGWRQEYLELALQKWLSSHDDPPDPGTMLLYHVVHLSMYVKFLDVELLARQVLAQGNHQDSNAYGRPSSPSPPLQQCFYAKDDQEKAVWHAAKILQIAQESKTSNAGSQQQPGGCQHPIPLLESSGLGEAPHYSHAVYYASMVLWWPSADVVDKAGCEEKYHSQAKNLRRGIDLLARSPSRAAFIFKRVLQSLEAQMHETLPVLSRTLST